MALSECRSYGHLFHSFAHSGLFLSGLEPLCWCRWASAVVLGQPEGQEITWSLEVLVSGLGSLWGPKELCFCLEQDGEPSFPSTVGCPSKPRSHSPRPGSKAFVPAPSCCQRADVAHGLLLPWVVVCPGDVLVTACPNCAAFSGGGKPGCRRSSPKPRRSRCQLNSKCGTSTGLCARDVAPLNQVSVEVENSWFCSGLAPGAACGSVCGVWDQTGVGCVQGERLNPSAFSLAHHTWLLRGCSCLCSGQTPCGAWGTL